MALFYSVEYVHQLKMYWKINGRYFWGMNQHACINGRGERYIYSGVRFLGMPLLRIRVRPLFSVRYIFGSNAS